MQFIQLSNLSYIYEDHYRAIFSKISFDIAAGERIALTGDNGAGKTTLLRIITGELTGFQGEISYPKEKPVIGYLPQDIAIDTGLSVRDELLATREDFYGLIKSIESYFSRSTLSTTDGIKLAELWDAYHLLQVNDFCLKIDSILADLNMTEYAATDCRCLSEGEKTRLQLGKLLVKEPDILILDEPTNHLDLENMQWLENWLLNFSGAILLVSHDRVFINHIATKIVELKRGEVTISGGDYDTFRKNIEDEHAHRMIQYQEQQKLISRLRTAAQQRRKWASSFQAETLPEGGGKKYESINNEVRTMHQQALNIEKRMVLLQQRYKVDKPWSDKKRNIRFPEAVSSSGTMVTCSDLSKRFDDIIVFEDLYFYAEKGEKIWLSGKNGSGKTTLMRIIAGIDKQYEGELVYGKRVHCGYYDQDLSNLPLSLTPLQYTEKDENDKSETRSFFGCLGLSGDIVNRKIAALSWGERSKVQLVKLLTAGHNLLLLDEPTNHLDITTRLMLEEALQIYRGTVVFVSHDRALISHTATREFNLDSH